MHTGNSVSQLKNFSDYFEAVPACNVCGSRERTEWTCSEPIVAYQCAQCGLVYFDPQLNKEGCEKFYSTGYFEIQNDPEDARKRDIMYGVEVAFLEKHIRTGKLLDIGCGGGFFLSKFNGQWEKYGLEIDPHAVTYAKEHFPFDFQCGEVQELSYPAASFDAITMRGVIEHYTQPREAIERSTPWLKSGGYFYITSTPNVESLCAELYREKWRLFTADHLLHFSKRTLVKLMGEYGYDLIDSTYFYLETPYANEIDDYRKILRDAALIAAGRGTEVDHSPPFYGNMLSLLFKKK